MTIRRNLRYHEFISEIDSFSGLSEHSIADMCVVIVLSHGDSGLVHSTDGRQIPIDWLLGKFNNDGCPALKGKPKLFIFQSCRWGSRATFARVALRRANCN